MMLATKERGKIVNAHTVSQKDIEEWAEDVAVGIVASMGIGMVFAWMIMMAFFG